MSRSSLYLLLIFCDPLWLLRDILGQMWLNSFSTPQWIFFKTLPSLPSYLLIIHWKLWEWLAALMKGLLFHTGMVLVLLCHLAQSEFRARYSVVWCECLFLLLALSAAAPATITLVSPISPRGNIYSGATGKAGARCRSATTPAGRTPSSTASTPSSSPPSTACSRPGPAGSTRTCSPTGPSACWMRTGTASSSSRGSPAAWVSAHRGLGGGQSTWGRLEG